MADAYALLSCAAKGDLDAQRALARVALDTVSNGSDVCDPVTTLIEGMVFARMAASHGTVEDQGTFIQLAALLADLDPDEGCFDPVAEAIARVSIAADAGSEEAAQMLPELAAGVAPEVMAAAQEIAKRIEGTN